MTRFKVDDQFHSHPKVIALVDEEPSAVTLWTLAGSWCCAGLTDGFVPESMLTRLVPRRAKALAEALVAAKLWIRVDGGYQFHDWQQFNLSAEQEKKRKADQARRQAEWRAKANAKRDALRNASSNGALSPPTPLPSGERGGEGFSREAVDNCDRCDQNGMHELPNGLLTRCFHPRSVTA